MKWALASLLVVFATCSCQPPCTPGDVTLIGQRYFLTPGTPITELLVHRGTCSDSQLTIESGTSGLRGEPSADVNRVGQGAQVRVYVPNAPLGESSVSVLVAGANRFFAIHVARALGVGDQRRVLTFAACSESMRLEGREFCNDEGVNENVIEFSGDSVIRRWPGKLHASAGNLYRTEGVAVTSFLGPHDGQRIAVDSNIVAVSGTPELLFVATARTLFAVDLISQKQLAAVSFPLQGEPTRMVASGTTVVLRTQRFSPLVTMLLRYRFVQGRLEAYSEPRQLTLESGLSSSGLVWQCGDGFLQFIDALGDGPQSSVSPLPGRCESSRDNPALWAGSSREAAFCPLGDPREGRFIGVLGFAPYDFICEPRSITGIDRLGRKTYSIDFSSLPQE